MAGHEVLEWVSLDWAGPRWVHKPEACPDWARKATQTAMGPEDGGANTSLEDTGCPHERLNQDSP